MHPTKKDLPFLNHIQKCCPSGLWSKGVLWVREKRVIPALVSPSSEGEWIYQVRVSDKAVSLKVTLWPEDEDWYCDCLAQQEICAHVAAVAVYVKIALAESGSSLEEALVRSSAQIQYHFNRNQGRLLLKRFIVSQGKRGEKRENELLETSLVAYQGGVQSGRISGLPLSVTREDYAIDSIISEKSHVFEASDWVRLFKILSTCSVLFLEGKEVKASSCPLKIKAQIEEEGQKEPQKRSFSQNYQFRLKQKKDPSVTEAFVNGAVLCGNVLKAVELPVLSPDERKSLMGSGTCYSSDDLRFLMITLLPSLQKKMEVEICTENLPKILSTDLKIVLEMHSLNHGKTLEVIARWKGDSGSYSFLDPLSETLLKRKLQQDLQLSLGKRTSFEGEEAIDFLLRAKNWECIGEGVRAFTVQEDSVIPKMVVDAGHFSVSFTLGSGPKEVIADEAFRAWRENCSYIPLVSGGFARLPEDWFERYGEKIEEIFEAQKLAKQNNAGSLESLPHYLIPEVIALCKETGGEVGASLVDFENYFNAQMADFSSFSDVELPSDLQAHLRTYQKVGVHWLCFLKRWKMGAMLADDMGLGKTLQTLCAIGGKTLIIAPTSVIFSWKEQIQRFRPSLKIFLHYGNSRNLIFEHLDEKSVVLTSYGTLKSDQKIFTDFFWDTLVLDEAQTIKNPDTQVTKVVHALRGKFKIALSGTPLENRLEDLWSQFHFINPGLLGSLESFQERFSEPMMRGDVLAGERLQQKIKPFLLRRLKKEVLEDLPPRIEKVLYCEFSPEERSIYDALLLSTRKEVLEKLEQGGNKMAAFELILGLRLSCCHPLLVLKKTVDFNVSKNSFFDNKLYESSKVSLLMEALKTSISCGHRALIFSQWTSYLDLIEAPLKKNGISFSRIDGTTRNRGEKVSHFQSEGGPSVMLISLKAGGVGLTLTAADHVFIMDPWWNPAVENQAADRSHRIGQKNPVLITRFIVRGTIEERIIELQKSKKELADSLFRNEIKKDFRLGRVTQDDLLFLLKD